MKKIILLLAVFAMLGFVGCDNGTTDDTTIIDSILGKSFTNSDPGWDGDILFFSKSDTKGLYRLEYNNEGAVDSFTYSGGTIYANSRAKITFNDNASSFDIELLVSNNSYWNWFKSKGPLTGWTISN